MDDMSTDTKSEAGDVAPPAQQATPQDPVSAPKRRSQPLKSYAQLLAEENAAMKAAIGPWQPRLEKSNKLLVSSRDMPCIFWLL